MRKNERERNEEEKRERENDEHAHGRGLVPVRSSTMPSKAIARLPFIERAVTAMPLREI